MRRSVLPMKAFNFLQKKQHPFLGHLRSISECTFSGSLLKASSAHPEKGTAPEPVFEKWPNGGGLFHKSACVDATAVIEAGAIVHAKSVLGANVSLGSGAVVGPSVVIGQSTKIGYNAALVNCFIGDSCIIHNGVCIGQDGFGFFVDEQGRMTKKPQMWHVRIGNHVEVGANTCIDRGSWRDTTIGDHSKIDNLVQIAHNVVIGQCCMLCGQVGLAGSVTIGDYVVLGGKVAVRDHVSIASRVRLAANSCVTKNITESGDYGGFPAVPIHEWRRQVASLRRTSKRSSDRSGSSNQSDFNNGIHEERKVNFKLKFFQESATASL